MAGVRPRHILDYFERGDNRNACVVCFFRSTRLAGATVTEARRRHPTEVFLEV